MQLSDIIRYFDVGRKINETSYQCKCPVHNDSKASMTVSEKDGKILIHCHAGCSTEDIMRAVGLTINDLQGDKPLHSWKSQLEGYVKKPLVDYYHYRDEAGKYLFTKLRLKNPDSTKAIMYGILDKDKDFMKLGKQGRKGTLYNISALLNAPRGVPVYIVEGEKDVETLKRLHLTAVTAGGASDWKKEYAKYFKGRKVVILQDNDSAGEKLTEKIKNSLRDFAHSIKVVVPSEREHGDVTDYIEDGHSLDDLKGIINSEAAIVAPWVEVPEEGSRAKIKINVGILAECIHKHEHFFIARKPGSESDLIYHYENGVYKLFSKTELTASCGEYLPSSILEPNTLRRIADSVIYTSSIKSFSDLNKSEKYINVKNGLYNIETKQLEQHSHNVISTIQLNCNYTEEYKRPERWHEFICDLCKDESGNIDIEMYDMLQEWLGFIFSNVYGYRAKRALTLYSAVGNTGKSVFITVCTSILGIHNVANVTFQEMDGSRWATGRLLGTRLVAVGDQGSGDLESSSVFKQLTGGDMVSAELKGKQGFDFIFTGVILVACNILPAFMDDKGDHIFKRLEFAHCRNVIPDELQDKTLTKKLIGEADQIFRWALQGLHRFIDNSYSFTLCESGRELKESYREEIDPLYAFVNEHCDITGNSNDRILKSEFNDEYIKFCELNDLVPLKRKNIPKRAQKLSIIEKKSGLRYYANVKWKELRPVLDRRLMKF